MVTLIEALTNPAIVAAFFTAVGGVLLKITERVLSKHADKREERKDHRDEIKELQDRLDSVEKEVTFWRGRFYEEQEDNAVLRVMIIQGGGKPPSKRVAPPE